MRVYIGVVGAQNSSSWRAHWCSVVAYDREKALDEMMLMARDSYPERDGWYDHMTNCSEIPQKLIETIYALYPRGR